ncbi:helix-turn-helix domain-containing protein [Lactobacillus sp. ESL0684]|uniref:BglG family transcription antiterminator n=1 Tax=Lactobacillus sp. ESL0684 TaxID=2983213 RepID=UPI0023F9FFF7|nr:helix-turn-helix domain-containing protein [Lactobacillus sp. ESL0684]WEV43606.1 helix-turn-helix domain-containing protein [Lactobacillus sp. ESL0684]
MTLTSRQTRIAIELLTNPQVYKVKDMSEKYRVSTRTLRSDLNKISEWLSAQIGCEYNSKPGKGIWISSSSDEERKAAINSLYVNGKLKNSSILYYSPDERKWLILTKLVFNNEYLTGKSLSETLNVSNNTFLSDLKSARKEAKRFQLSIIGKNYYGYKLIGDEIDVRSLMEYILQKHIDYYTFEITDTLNMIIKISLDCCKDLDLPLSIRRIMSAIALSFSDDLSETLSSHSTDRNIIKSMINRLTVIIFENKSGKRLISHDTKHDLQRNQEKYLEVYTKIMKKFEVKKSLQEEKYFVFGVSDFNGHPEAVAVKIINYVSNKLKLTLNQDITLLDSLVQHITTEFNSDYQYSDMYTPFTYELKSKYPEVFLSVKEALRIFVSENPIIINDAFITMISLHFVVAINDFKNSFKVKAMYVCSSGKGATSVLRRSVEQEISCITCVGFASLSNYLYKAKELGPDIIISIFMLNEITTIPTIQVNPIPTKQDIIKIENELKKLNEKVNLASNRLNLDYPEQKLDVENTEHVLSMALEAFIRLKKHFINQIDNKYMDAFMIHVEMATDRIFFNKQYTIQTNEDTYYGCSSEDFDFIKKTFLDLNLDINTTEIIAILKYTEFR